MGVDALLLSFSVWMSFWLRLAHPLSPQVVAVGSWLVPAALVLGLPLYVLTGQYKGLSRYVGSRALYDLIGRTAVLTLLLVAVGSLLRWPMPPRSSWVLFWILLTGFSGAARFVLRDLLLGWQRAREGQVINTVIYGAGAAGAQLARSLLFDQKHALLAFVDDDPRLWGRSLAGVDVMSPQELSGLEADRVLLAMPSLKRAERRRIVDQLQDLGVPVLQVPSIEEITSGRARIDSLRPVAIEELLGRAPEGARRIEARAVARLRVGRDQHPDGDLMPINNDPRPSGRPALGGDELDTDQLAEARGQQQPDLAHRCDREPRRREDRVVVRVIVDRRRVQIAAGGLRRARDLPGGTGGGPLEVHMLEDVRDPDLIVGLVEIAGAHPRDDGDDGRRRVTAREDREAVGEPRAADRRGGEDRVERAQATMRRRPASALARRKLSASFVGIRRPVRAKPRRASACMNSSSGRSAPVASRIAATISSHEPS